MDDNSKIMELAYEAGAILLENGAEISRVDETMQRIAGHYGVDDESFFVLTNGIRDLAHEDYIAGVTRLLDAMLVFFCIALGVALAFILDAAIYGQMQVLEELTAAPETAGMVVQLVSAFIGTVAFAVLFGVPRRYYLDCGFCGMVGWLLYLILMNYTGLSVANMVFFATVLVAFTALVQAIVRKCPITVYLICGIFPLVPGAGIFWTTYNLVSEQLGAALHSGITALKVTVAIAFGIIMVAELNGKNRIGKMFVKSGK